MATTLTCLCGRKLQIREEMAGQKGECPGCGRILDLPPPQSDAVEQDFVAAEMVDQRPPGAQEQNGPLPEVQAAPRLAEPYPSVVQFSPGTPPAFAQPPPYVPIQAAGPGELLNHNQQTLPRKLDFFAPPPPEIGPLMSGFSTLRRDQKPVSLGVRLTFVFSSIIAGAFAAIFFGLAALPVLVVISLGLCLLTTLLSWFLTGFKHRCTYVGRGGVARFTCNGGRHNLRSDIFIFAEAVELRTAQTRHFYNGGYTGTSYSFTWTDFNGRKVFTLGGQYKSLQGTPKAKDPFYFAVAAETAWSLHLLAQAPQQLEAGGSIRFGLKGTDSIRLGTGVITLTRKDETMTFRGEDIARLRIQQGIVSILEPDAKEGWFSSTGVYKFAYSELANAQFFLFLLHQLFGIQASA